MRTWIAMLVVCFGAAMSADAAGGFANKPVVVKGANGSSVEFALDARNDVEVAILDAQGRVVRHLTAGVLGGEKAPPAPLAAGLSQKIAWDGKDDFGKAAAGGPFRARVRLGVAPKFGRFIGGDPCSFGALNGVAADEEGNVYLMGFAGEANQGQMAIRVFDPQGRYLRELLPFPADLPPDSMKDIAEWDEQSKSFVPHNCRNLNPDFYGQPGSGNISHYSLTLVSASAKGGVLLTDGRSIFRIDARGAVPQESFKAADLWAKKAELPNSGDGPVHLRSSPDGKFLYLSGPYSTKTAYGHVADPRFPPGQVYRMEIGRGTMEPFAKLPTVGEHAAKPGYTWVSKHIAFPQNYTVPHGPIHDIAIDKAGNVFVADQDGQRIAVFDAGAREIASVPVAYPDILAINPAGDALYVLTKEIKGYHKFAKTVVKLAAGADGWKNAKTAATFDLGVDDFAIPTMALSAGKDGAVLWLSGVRGGVMALADKGESLVEAKTQFAPAGDLPVDWTRLAVDADRDELYISNGTTRMWRFDGSTGKGELLSRGGKPFYMNDLAVGYDGNLYIRLSGEDGTVQHYSGAMWRLDRDLKPVPFDGIGTHVLSPYIYSRYGVGYAERGLAAGPRGECYTSFMYRWVAYAIGGFAPDGKPMKGKYLEGEFPGKGKYPPDWTSAIIGPLPQANGGIRVDLQGRVYAGVLYWPKEQAFPKGREKEYAWKESVGSVVRFGPEGGRMTGKDDQQRAEAFEGIDAVYVGLAPFSKSGLAGNTCCVCRTPRFDIDRYGRLAIPNALSNSVRIVDNSGNVIAEFGQYGNFDSQFVNANTESGRAGKPTVATPTVPLAWPTCAGFGRDCVYVLDTYGRRVVRVNMAWAAEEMCAMP